MPIRSIGIMCRSPYTIAKVNEGYAKKCELTAKTMQHLALRTLDQSPDQIVIISPMTARLPDRFGVSSQSLAGNLTNFKAPGVKTKLPFDVNFAGELCKVDNSRFEILPQISLDHGVIVPLWYLQQAGWQGFTSFLTLPASTGPSDLHAAGESFKAFCRDDPQSIGIILSLELSRSLNERSPLGMHEDGQKFDEAICQSIQTNTLAKIKNLSQHFVKNANEDAYESLIFCLPLLESGKESQELMSYENQLGIGFLVASLYEAEN